MTTTRQTSRRARGDASRSPATATRRATPARPRQADAPAGGTLTDAGGRPIVDEGGRIVNRADLP